MAEKNIDESLESLYDEDSTKGDRHYSRIFASAYGIVRPAFVLLNKAKRNKYSGKGKDKQLVKKAQVTNKEAVEKLRAVLEDALNKLE